MKSVAQKIIEKDAEERNKIDKVNDAKALNAFFMQEYKATREKEYELKYNQDVQNLNLSLDVLLCEHKASEDTKYKLKEEKAISFVKNNKDKIVDTIFEELIK
ncbi:MAG: hypothetical protein LBV51_05215 [Acholeplasmatales bacterium]|jgi:hypothetical protein|nr:hypothetical protein [Acholeplasmatales bacterium]